MLSALEGNVGFSLVSTSSYFRYSQPQLDNILLARTSRNESPASREVPLLDSPRGMLHMTVTSLSTSLVLSGSMWNPARYLTRVCSVVLLVTPLRSGLLSGNTLTRKSGTRITSRGKWGGAHKHNAHGYYQHLQFLTM